MSSTIPNPAMQLVSAGAALAAAPTPARVACARECHAEMEAAASSCRMPNLTRFTRRSVLPFGPILRLCSSDTIPDPGRPRTMTTRPKAFSDAVNDARRFNPRKLTPVSDVKGAGDLTLTLRAAAAAGAAATDRGNDHLVVAFIFTIDSNSQINLPAVTVSFTGTLEDGSAWSHTARVKQSQKGTSYFLVLPSLIDENSNCSFALARVRRDVIVGNTGVSTALTAAAAPNDATLINFANPLRSAELTAVATVTAGGTGTTFGWEAVTPQSEYYSHVEELADAAELLTALEDVR